MQSHDMTAAKRVRTMVLPYKPMAYLDAMCS